MRPDPRAIAAAASVLALPPTAHAGVVSADPLAETSTEAGVVARTFELLLAGKTLAPPYLPEDDDPLAQGLFDLRFYVVKTTPSWKLVIHDELTGAARSAALPSGSTFGRGVQPPRWLPLTATIVDRPTATLRDRADWLYLAWNHGPVTLTVGRQPVTFGRAHLGSPMDLIGPFALTEVDTEYKPGVDAVRLDWTASEGTEVTLLGAAGELADDTDLEATLTGSASLARVTRHLEHAELGALAGYVRGDAVAGVDGVWTTAHADLRGEVTLTRVSARSVDSPMTGPGDVIPKAAAGASLHLARTLTVAPELLYNGFGAWKPADYLAVAASGRVAIGEETMLGRLYAGGTADWEAHPLVHVNVVALANLRDVSALGSLAVAYSVSDNASALVGAYVPIGSHPDPAMPVAARSEYGLYPAFAFLELKVVL